MENPVVLSKEDWSLGNHQLGFVYDVQDGTTDGAMAFIGDLKAGTTSMGDNERFDQFIETFDLLCEYNINKEDPLGALYEQDPIFMVDGDAAIWANGCWAWPNLAEAGASTDDEYAFVPFVFGNDITDFANTGIEAAANNGFDALDPLAFDIQEKMKSGNTYSSAFIAPGDHWSVLGASMQQYLAGVCSKEELASQIDEYWTAIE